MPIELPGPIAAYFIADRHDGDAVARCFTAHAVVKDEGHIYRGRAAIRQWKADAASRYRYRSEPFAIAQKEEHAVVSSRVAGDFPGSPIELRYFFMLEGERIVSLEILP